MHEVQETLWENKIGQYIIDEVCPNYYMHGMLIDGL
jgi:hypothetical protein